jgi:DNA-binding CsgD family transcriptional regulator/N-acetylneuraminic acid mutarotase
MPELGEPLSDRELDVLRGLAAGAANKEIADDLSISPYTVKTHLRNIYTKLGVSTRTEAMTVAMQQGLLVMPGVPGLEHQATAETSPMAGPAQTPAIIPEASARPAPSHRWRNISLILVAALLLAAGLVFAQWRTGGVPPTGAPPFEEQAIGETRWLASRPLPEPRTGQAVAAVGLDVYVIGGRTETGIAADVIVFDTRERAWRHAAAKPTPVTDATADELFGEIYVAGGLRADGRPTDIVEAYSPSQNAWRRVAPLPQPLAGGLVVAEGGYLYVFGGWNGESVLDTAYLYDPGADSWRPLAGMPEPRTAAAGDSLTGRIYVVGGSDEAAEQATCFSYNPADDSWAACPDMLQTRASAGATVLLNKLYVLGGMDPVAPGAAQGELFDPNTGAWTVLNLPPESVPWVQPGVTHVENRIYAMGGRQANELSDANLVYSPFVFQTFIPAASSDNDE